MHVKYKKTSLNYFYSLASEVLKRFLSYKIMSTVEERVFQPRSHKNAIKCEVCASLCVPTGVKIMYDANEGIKLLQLSACGARKMGTRAWLFTFMTCKVRNVDFYKCFATGLQMPLFYH